MDIQAIFNVCATTGILAIGWFCRTMYEAVKTLEQSFANHRVEDASTLATRESLHNTRNELAATLSRLQVDMTTQNAELRKDMNGGFERLFNKIDSKADK